MTAFRRRPAESAPERIAPTNTPAPFDVPAYVDRSLIILTTKLQTCLERLEKLETRMDDLAEQLIHAPSHSDVLEVRMHSAKLAAEMARATVELRGEIGMAAEESRRLARYASQPIVDAALDGPNLDLIHQEEAAASAAYADAAQKPHPFSATA